MFLMFVSEEVGALDTNTMTYYEHWNGGSYYGITVDKNITNSRSTSKFRSKTVKYKNVNGKTMLLWQSDRNV